MKKLVPILIGLIFICIAVYISFDFESVTKSTIARLGFGWVITTILLRAIIMLSFARGCQLLCQVFVPKIKGWLVFIIGLLLGFGVSFITPIYESDYGDYNSNQQNIDHPGLTTLTDGNYHVQDRPYILAFFTSDCSHCKNAAKLLGFAESIGNTPKIIAVFPGSYEDATAFIQNNNGQAFEYYTVDNDDYFIENSGAIFPSIYLIGKDGQTMAHWFGDEFNYTALDYLESISK